MVSGKGVKTKNTVIEADMMLVDQDQLVTSNSVGYLIIPTEEKNCI
jgi:hypothetical protein